MAMWPIGSARADADRRAASGRADLYFDRLFPVYSWLLASAVLLGIANSVYHPADYSILGSVIDPPRLGRAFSIHTFAGYLGSALAPMTMLLMTHLWACTPPSPSRTLWRRRGGAADVRGWLEGTQAARVPAGGHAHVSLRGLLTPAVLSLLGFSRCSASAAAR